MLFDEAVQKTKKKEDLRSRNLHRPREKAKVRPRRIAVDQASQATSSDRRLEICKRNVSKEVTDRVPMAMT